ncbi:MAG TPA: YegS/Rv2252/BmrU family lipid kinase [Ktedonobacteraceae bacterium]|nr:YegS/Rv2252/BmrU family lipid kinase [Ktedonobacteraceae bacterium]
MKSRRTSLVINPRAGQNLAKIADIQAILAAAGWKTELALKEYGGQAITLATQAAENDNDLVIAYGGDGTLNQVVNGVMQAKHRQSVIGLIPGGTANVWANEIGIPEDPVKAALALINSEVRKVDLGHVMVEGITSTGSSSAEHAQSGKKAQKKQAKTGTRVRQHFLLMAGLGIDAAIMNHVSRPLKYHMGALAVGASTVRTLPEHRPFPIEIHAGDDANGSIHWKGEALQVVIGNTRLYADIVQMTPEAHIDDGILDVCIVTAGTPLTTMQQLGSLLLRHQPDNRTAEYFQGTHFSISVPASIALQLDGSAVKLKKYLRKADLRTLTQVENLEQITVTYRFDARPRALKMAIPRTYDGALFEQANQPAAQSTEETEGDDTQEERCIEQATEQELTQIQGSLEQGQKVTVLGIVPNPAAKHAYIIAGSITRQDTGEVQPVAVQIDTHTLLRKQTGEHFLLEALPTLQTGHAILVEGKKSKRGVIRARQLVI